MLTRRDELAEPAGIADACRHRAARHARVRHRARLAVEQESDGRISGDLGDHPAEPLPAPAEDADFETPEVPSAARRALSAVSLWLGVGWRWFRDFRRTRPFWGGLWMMLGGWTIMSLTIAPIVVMLSAGASGVAGYVTGGGLMVLGLIAWFAPTQRLVAGVMGGILAVAAFVASNLGGFLLGTLLGILGSAMVFGWGPKKPRKRAES
ncbi:MAG TPA: DUF6114 domain-containing protein [Actinokineospora sp.]|nr:DUF6114 domain-containing protein [Actinokineospora sp.]